MATGKTKDGENGLWVDDYSVYDESNPEVAATLESMRGQETKFWDAPEFLTNEWVNLENEWDGRKSVYP